MKTNSTPRSLSFPLSRSSEIGYALSLRSNPGLKVSSVAIKKTASLLRAISYVDRFSPRTRRDLRALRSLKKTREGQKALIVAGGPSVSHLDPRAIGRAQAAGNLEVFVMNRFVYSNMGEKITPDWVVFSDPASFKPLGSTSQFTSSLSQYPFATALVPLDIDLGPSVWEQWQNRVVRFEDRSLEGWGRGTNPTKLRRYISLTALKAMALTLFFGYQEIGVIGLDNTLHKAIHVDGANRIFQEPLHVSGAGHPAGTQISRREENGETTGTVKNLADFFYNEATMHLHLDKFFKPTGCFVNLSQESDLVSFDRKSLISFLR